MSLDCSKSNVCDGSRPLRSDPGLTISATHRSPHSSSTAVGWHRVGRIVSSLVHVSSVRRGPPSGPGRPADCPLIKLGFSSTRRLPCPISTPKVRIDWSTSSRTSGSPTPVGPSNTGDRRWTGQAPTWDELDQQDLRGVSLSESLGGMGHIEGWITPSALRRTPSRTSTHLMPPPRPGDTRTPRQRRHDALEDLARHFLDHGDTPTVGGEKPHINLVCDLPALQGIAGGLHETENGHLLTVMELRALACDCSLSRIVFGPDGEIIDVGRRTRVVPTALRRALIARDRHCTWHGCDRDPRWCDAHHIEALGKRR